MSRLVELGFAEVQAPCAVDITRQGRWSWRAEAIVPAMGTRVTVITVTPSRQRAEDAMAAVRSEMDRLIRVFDRHNPGSVVSVLNADGRVEDPSPELRAVLATARDVHRATGGAFDITITPVVDMLAAAAAAGREPSPQEVADARARVDAAAIAADSRRVWTQREGIRLTFDGIAKGAIVDAMARTLRRSGVRRYLVDGGGDIRVRGRNPRGEAWTIGVKDPERGAVHETVAVRRGAIATSGGYARPLGAIDHHIADRTSGRSPRTCRSVSVMAPTAGAADALATGMFVLGPAQALHLADRIPSCACLVVDDDGRRHSSRRWPTMRRVSNESDVTHD